MKNDREQNRNGDKEVALVTRSLMELEEYEESWLTSPPFTLSWGTAAETTDLELGRKRRWWVCFWTC